MQMWRQGARWIFRKNLFGQEPSCVLSALDAEIPRCLAYHVIISYIALGGAHVRRGLKGGDRIQLITIEPLIEESEEAK